MPPEGTIERVEEPYVTASIILPTEFVGTIMELCQGRRADFVEMKYLSPERVEMHYRLPLSEIVLDFFDQLKSRTRGYASLDYEVSGYRESDLVKLDILLAGEPVDALALIVPRERAHVRGKALVEKLRQKIPRQLFEVAVQAAIGSHVVARETIKAKRKDVLAKCYGGDITRKRKLLEKQKEGKKRMKQLGAVEVPQEAFLAVLELDPRVVGRGEVSEEGPRLVRPALAYHASFLAALAEYHAEGRHLELDAVALADAEEFARYVAALNADVERPGESARFIARLSGTEPETYPDGYVPQTTLWWVAGAEYLGRLAIRHRLTPHLLRRGRQHRLRGAALGTAAEGTRRPYWRRRCRWRPRWASIRRAWTATPTTRPRSASSRRTAAGSSGRRTTHCSSWYRRDEWCGGGGRQRGAAPRGGRPRHVYIHVPFCRAKCDYCDFASVAVGDEAERGRCSTTSWRRSPPSGSWSRRRMLCAACTRCTSAAARRACWGRRGSSGCSSCSGPTSRRTPRSPSRRTPRT